MEALPDRRKRSAQTSKRPQSMQSPPPPRSPRNNTTLATLAEILHFPSLWTNLMYTRALRSALASLASTSAGNIKNPSSTYACPKVLARGCSPRIPETWRERSQRGTNSCGRDTGPWHLCRVRPSPSPAGHYFHTQEYICIAINKGPRLLLPLQRRGTIMVGIRSAGL